MADVTGRHPRRRRALSQPRSRAAPTTTALWRAVATAAQQAAQAPAAGVFAVALTLYLATAAPDLTWANYGADGGELITAAVTLGVPHPPGYPLYVLLGHGLSLWPGDGSMAWRFNLFSALCTALAAALCCAAPRQASLERRWAGGLLLIGIPLIWSQAVIAEVYALNWLLAALVWWGVQRRWPAGWLGLVWGISITTHLTSLLLGPLVLSAQRPRAWGRLGLGALAGLTPWLALPWLGRQGSPVVWGDPITWQGWWWLVSAQLYRPNLFHAPLTDWPARLGQAARLTWPVAVAGLLSLRAARRARPDSTSLAVALTISAYLVWSLGYDTRDAVVLWLPGAGLLSAALVPCRQRLSWFVWLLPALALGLNLATQDLTHSPSLRARAAPLLAEAPYGALILTPGDASIFVLWYFQHVEKQRPDLMLVDANLLAFDWYRQRLQQQYPTLRQLAEDDVSGFQQANAVLHPICVVSLEPDADTHCMDK